MKTRLTNTEKLCWDVMRHAAFSEETGNLTSKEVNTTLVILFGEATVEKLRKIIKEGI